jgi:signal transduction histidine kinase
VILSDYRSRPSAAERMGLTTRWVWLAGLSLAAGFTQTLTREVGFLLIVWAGLTVALSLGLARGDRRAATHWGIAAVDSLLAILVVAGSGGPVSPLWSALLLPAVILGLEFGGRSALTAAAIGSVVASAISILGRTPPGMTALAAGVMAIATLVCAGGLAWSVDRLRRAVSELSPDLSAPPMRAPAAGRVNHTARTVLQMAAELNSTLNYERVLDLALDLSASAIGDSGADDDRLVSALLLVQDNELALVSGRRLPNADLRVTLPGEAGTIARALETGRPDRAFDPAHDPELQRLVGLHGCQVTLCLPLTAGLESYGLLLFGHPQREFFDPERVQLLEAIAQQSMVAMQNARLYRELEQEKERITEIQEEARKKLARDLHDGPTQSIAAIAMRVNFARRLMERDSRAASAELYKVEDLARRTTKEIRHMLFTLRPLILETQGLVAALQQLAEKVHDTHEQNVLIEAEPRVADDLEVGKQGVIFYIAEEAINNARKHAEAEHIWVRLRRDPEFFTLEVQDDGVGFNVGAVDENYEQRGSLGMVNMRERAELVSGALRLDSAEGQGTRISLVVPLSMESAERLQRAGYGG